MMRKLGFHLAVEDEWPPYEVEHIWTEQVGGLFRIKNYPFFLKGVSYDDLISAQVGPDDYVDQWVLVAPSTNSLVWIIDENETDIGERLIAAGCDVERDDHYGLISANVPAGTDRQRLDGILKEYEASGQISVAVPVDRIGLLTLE